MRWLEMYIKTFQADSYHVLILCYYPLIIYLHVSKKKKKSGCKINSLSFTQKVV